MGRALKAWKRRSTGWWYVEIDGKQIRLSKTKQEAERMVADIKRQRLLGEPTVAQAVTVGEVLDGYLGWCEKNRAEKTYGWYRHFLQSFVSHDKAVAKIKAEDLKSIHVTEWVDGQDWGKSTKRGAMICLQRAYNWAVRQGLLPRSPIGTLEKPQAGRRETPAKEADLDVMLKACTHQAHRDLLVMSYETGARPQEVKMLAMEYFSEPLDAFIIPVSQAKGKERVRVIHLTDRSREIVNRLRSNDGTLLKNTQNEAWTTGAVNCLMRRLTKKTGKKFAAYDLRHGRATELLEAGIDHLTVSAILGHVDSSTLARVYSHVAGNAKHLKEALKANQRTGQERPSV